MLKQRQELLDFAMQLAEAAADQIIPYYRNCAASTKSDGTGEVPYNLTALIHQAKKFRFCGDCLQHALASSINVTLCSLSLQSIPVYTSIRSSLRYAGRPVGGGRVTMSLLRRSRRDTLWTVPLPGLGDSPRVALAA